MIYLGEWIISAFAVCTVLYFTVGFLLLKIIQPFYIILTAKRTSRPWKLDDLGTVLGVIFMGFFFYIVGLSMIRGWYFMLQGQIVPIDHRSLWYW